MLNSTDFELLETIGGNWVKVGPGVRWGTFAIELGNILLCIRISNQDIDLCAKDSNGIYQYLGNLSFKSTKANQLTTRFSSPAIENILIGEDSAPITNLLTTVQNLTINFTKEQKDKWLDKVIPK